MRIKDLPLAGSVSDGDYLAIDNAVDGTQKTTRAQIVSSVSVIRVTTPSFSSLSKTYNATGVNADMVVLGYSLSNPAAQVGDWTITTGANIITIAGAIKGTTTLTVTLVKPVDDVTATT